jgi:hypothetical protein
MSERQQSENNDKKTIANFKSALSGGGARNNLFEVILSFPTFNDVEPTENGNPDTTSVTELLNNSRLLIKAAALPASTIAPIDVPFRGRILKVAGDRTFETWTITVINDNDFTLRTKFEQWMNNINNVKDSTGTLDPAVYQADARVIQLNRNGKTLREYKFRDIFPTNISTIDLNYETTDTIEEFTVEFQVLYWEAYGADEKSNITGNEQQLAGTE